MRLDRSLRAQRRPKSKVTPAYEDAGLFKTGLVDVTTLLTPTNYRNSRDDLIIHGTVFGDTQIEVVFAGRRSVMAVLLLAQLEVMQANAERSAHAAGERPPLDQDVRMRVRIEGAWRRRVAAMDPGLMVRIPQLVASRWIILARDKKKSVFGVPPVVEPPT